MADENKHEHPPNAIELALAHIVCAAASEAWDDHRERSIDFTRALIELQRRLFGPTRAFALMLAVQHGAAR